MDFYAFQVYIILLTYYYNIISLFGLSKVEEEEDREPKTRFAIAVAAHNEERVIGQIIDNLKLLDYPKELYDVYVICDNCNDNTANVVREKGAYALERFDQVNKGKGYAIKWFLEKLFQWINNTMQLPFLMQTT
ncbi:glycosyltransferase family 2 protein [Caloramator sp. Dgby_cultured_2]|uniref:glycosyltransferase family 2 protein n=1 Tax=Caloramator sp. Dgby_cultured_2 TaxID=3029174 RepID=UPI00237D7D4B|nr:glycosyltransferase family 2 protein [Caloramator sp. Dgby_cultured_2]WDU82099.1 glycosyltransferase family 2 protein [Caloramator sp. Dgby_cultured_2]